MSTRTITQLIDDITGGEADETVSFALDGQAYEIELNDRNAAGLRRAFEVYIQRGRKVGSVSRGLSLVPPQPVAKPKRGPSRAEHAAELQAIREWAMSNGHQVNARGRIPETVVQAYREANA